MNTLRHSYSMTDLGFVPNSGAYEDYDNQGTNDRRVKSQSWHEGHSTGRISEHFKEDDSPVQTGAVSGRRKPHTGSLKWSQVIEAIRIPGRGGQHLLDRRNMPPLHQFLEVDHYMAKTKIPFTRELQPLIRRSALSKENVSLDESDVDTSFKHKIFSA